MTKLMSHWNQCAKIYDKQSDCVSVLTQQLWNMLKISQADSILEIGCGTGYLLPLLVEMKKPSCRVIALDLSKEMINIATRRMDKYSSERKVIIQNQQPFVDDSQKLTPPYSRTTLTHYPHYDLSIGVANSEQLDWIPDASFDVYSASQVLHLTDDHEKMLREAHRVLKVGGRVGCSVWGRQVNSSLQTIFDDVLDQNHVARDKSARTPFHLNNRDALIHIFRNSGFSNLVCWYSIVPFSVFDVSDLEFIVQTHQLPSLSDEQHAKIMMELKAALDLKLHQCQPLTMEGLLITGYKS